MSKYPTVFTKKPKINMRVCGYMLDLTHLVCPALQSHHLITQKYYCSFFPVKIEMLYESCTNMFFFHSHVNFNILTHFLNVNFKKSLHRCRVCPKIGDFFYFPFFSDRPTDPSGFEKNPCSRKLNWSGLRCDN